MDEKKKRKREGTRGDSSRRSCCPPLPPSYITTAERPRRSAHREREQSAQMPLEGCASHSWKIASDGPCIKKEERVRQRLYYRFPLSTKGGTQTGVKDLSLSLSSSACGSLIISLSHSGEDTRTKGEEEKKKRNKQREKKM